MKRLSLLLVLLTIFNCADEPLEPEQRACVESSAALVEATSNFNNVTPSTFTELCNNYRIALQNQKEFCGDRDGTLQTLLDGLGDCTGTQPPGDCNSALEVSNAAEANYNSDNSDSNCNAYKLALQNQIAVCGDAGGNIQVIIDDLGDCSTDSVGHYALMTANIAGEQFDDLVPLFYPLVNTAVSVVSFAQDNDTEKFLLIQGNSTPNEINEMTKEINLYIPERLFTVGVYNLENSAFDESSIPQANFKISYFDDSEYDQAFEEPGGTLEITEIDLVNRNIKGTFEFSFKRSSPSGPDIGPFECLNGTFDYDLDDDYFN